VGIVERPKIFICRKYTPVSFQSRPWRSSRNSSLRQTKLLITTVCHSFFNQRCGIPSHVFDSGIRANPNIGDTGFENGLNSAILRYRGENNVEPATQQTISVIPMMETDLHVSSRVTRNPIDLIGISQPVVRPGDVSILLCCGWRNGG